MATGVEYRILRGLGHVLRMEQKRIPKEGLRCNPTKGNREGQK